jgi:hypothetical protein
MTCSICRRSRLVNLTLDLADYSLKDVVHTVVTAVEPLATSKALALTAEVGKDLPTGHGDGRRLAQVLLNLVGNAIKFTDRGQVTINATASDGLFTVAVSDTGPGIASSDQLKLFKEFLTCHVTPASSPPRTRTNELCIDVGRRRPRCHLELRKINRSVRWPRPSGVRRPVRQPKFGQDRRPVRSRRGSGHDLNGRWPLYDHPGVAAAACAADHERIPPPAIVRARHLGLEKWPGPVPFVARVLRSRFPVLCQPPSSLISAASSVDVMASSASASVTFFSSLLILRTSTVRCRRVRPPHRLRRRACADPR